MELQTWIYYALAILVLTSSPGPSALLCISKSATQGFAHGILSGLGSLLAIVCIMTLSFTGLGAVIASSEIIFAVIRYLGALYLIYLGYKSFTSTQESYRLTSDNDNNFFKSFSSGFLVGASNPKAIVFFVALFPQFIDTTQSLATQYLIFVSTFAILELSFLSIYSYLGHRSSDWLLAKGRAKFFNKITGSIFMGAGAYLSTSKP